VPFIDVTLVSWYNLFFVFIYSEVESVVPASSSIQQADAADSHVETDDSDPKTPTTPTAVHV